MWKKKQPDHVYVCSIKSIWKPFKTFVSSPTALQYLFLESGPKGWGELQRRLLAIHQSVSQWKSFTFCGLTLVHHWYRDQSTPKPRRPCSTNVFPQDLQNSNWYFQTDSCLDEPYQKNVQSVTSQEPSLYSVLFLVLFLVTCFYIVSVRTVKPGINQMEVPPQVVASNGW